MKILVFAHELELGGTQTNAIELTERLRTRHGHDVVLFATPGPAGALAAERNIRLLPAPAARRHPSLSRGLALRAAVKAERPDVIHVWDWPQCLDAFFATAFDVRTPLVCSSMGMVVARVLPSVIPTTFGTPALHALAMERRPRTAFLLEPPVDLERNQPGAVDGGELRRSLEVADDEVLVVAVSRLTDWMKLEGLQRLVTVAGRQLARHHHLRVAIVGEGPAAPRLSALAAQINEAAGRVVVSVPGPMVDPRPAYAAADIVVGMGGSGLRAMAFAKPLVVVGERGFSEVFSSETSDAFVWNGIFGEGDGNEGAAQERLARQLDALIVSEAYRHEVAAHGHNVVTERYGLDHAADALDCLLRTSASGAPAYPTVVRDGIRVAGVRWGRSALPRSRQLIGRLRSS